MFPPELDAPDQIQDAPEQQAADAAIVRDIESPPLRLPRVTFSVEGVTVDELAQLIRAFRGT